jgi:hypothetical protein
MTSRGIRIGGVLTSLVVLVGCGSGIEGTYSGRGNGFLQQMVFKRDGKVELTFMGMTREGTFEVEGKRVKVTNGGTTEILTIGDDGCLEGGGILGRYCKTDAAPADGLARSTGGLSGTWEAKHPQGSIALAFMDDDEVRVTITEGQTVDDSSKGTYSMRGNRITVSVAGGEPLELTRKDDTLEGWIQGVGMRFVRK